MKKTCCIIGDRDIPAGCADFIKQELRREIEEAIAEGYTRFISGFGKGAELYFAEIVGKAAGKQGYPVGGGHSVPEQAGEPDAQRRRAKAASFLHGNRRLRRKMHARGLVYFVLHYPLEMREPF